VKKLLLYLLVIFCFLLLGNKARAQQASNLSVTAASSTSITVNSWTNNSGNHSAVFVLAGTTGTPAPVNTTNYTANTVFGSGGQIGTSGWYCVYNSGPLGTTGAGPVTVTGLTAGTTYRVMVVDYQSNASPAWTTGTGTNNPANVTTPSSAKRVTAIATGSQTGTATYGTAAPSITYVNTLTETGTAAAVSNTISIAWSGGTPTGVTTAFTAGTQAMTSGTTYTPNGTNGSTLKLTVSTTTATPAGAHTFTITNVDNNGGGTTFSTGTLTVGRAALTITATNQTKTYGAANPTLTVSYSGFVNGDTYTSLTTQPTIATTGVTSSPVGTYPITATGAVDANYTISPVAGTLTVTQAALTIKPNNQTRSYGTANPTLTVSYSGFVNGDTYTNLTTQPTVSTTAIATSPVGPYAINATGAVDGNYAISYTPGTLTITALVSGTYDWTGAVSTAWANPQNWDIAGVQQTLLYPGSAITGDIADIGVNYNYTTNQPVVTTALPYNVGSINLGANNGTAITLTVTGVTLTVTGAITQNHNSANGGVNTTVTGTGAINCGSLTVGDNTAPPAPSGSIFGGLVPPTQNSTTFNISILTLTIGGNITLNSTSSTLGTYDFFVTNYCVNNPILNLISGTVTANNIITSNSNYVNNTDIFGVTIANSTTYQQTGSNTNTLNLLGNTPITFATGANIDFVTGTAGANSYVNYQAASGTQTVYTSADGINTTPSAYANLTLSAASAKTVDGGTLTVGENFNNSGGAVNLNSNNPVVTVNGSWTNATTTTQGTGNITIAGSVTNNSGGTLALGSGNFYIAGNYTNNVGGVYTQSTGTTYFNGATQALVDNSTTGTTFNNVTFNGNGTATMSAGTNNVNFAVSSSGVLTMTSPAKLVAGSSSAAYLTLNSDATGSAAVAPITYTAPISGYVNVQRYLTGSRGYRLISSPVYAGTSGAYTIYSLNYLYNNLYLTGSGGTAGGFTAGGNPTLYLYDEGFTPYYSTFLNSNFIGISSLSGGTGTTPTYSLNTNGAGLVANYSLPVGTGFLCFFRGSLSEGSSNLTNPSYTALTATVSATGNLVQGQVYFRDWYNSGSTSLGSSNQNFNLVGNPYASAIDLGTIPTATTTTKIYATPYNNVTNTGITKFIYELNPLSHVFGVYTDDGSLPATNGASEYIASGQGFFVQAYGSGTQFIFNETGKATSTNATATNGLMVTKADLATLNQSAANPLLQLQFVLDTINTEESVIEFNPSAKQQFVINEDAAHRTGQGLLNFSSISSDNVPLAVNSLPLQKTMSIPLSVSGSPDGLYKINMKQVVPLPGLYDIWLIDSYKKDSLDIKVYPSYSFDILHSDTASFGANRFKLVVRQNPALMVHLLNFGATKVATGDQVIWTTENEENYTSFSVERSTDGGSTFNVLGGVASSGIGSYSLLDKAPVAGANAYRLKMTDLNGTVTYSNVVTIMYANTGNQVAIKGFILYPNPTAGLVNLAINAPAQTTGSGAYTIQIINNLGAIIKTAISNQSTWQTDVSNLMPGTYFVQVKNNSTNNLVGKSAFVKL